MMVAVDNKLPQPPNANWHPIGTVPYGEQLAFTDVNKVYAWIGYIADSSAPLPTLKAGGAVSADQAPAFWSHLADQS